MEPPADRSYRALLAVPGLPRVLVAMVAARIGLAMLSVVVVLFALDEYDSTAVAGAAGFCGLFPGLVAAPLVGALLDRAGRVRLIRLDYVVTAVSLALLSALSVAGALPVPLFLAIVLVFGTTQMFSDAGTRSLLPSLVPAGLWERVNAADSNGYLVAWVLGPPLAATLVGSSGGVAGFVATAAFFAVAAVATVGVREPRREARAPTRLRDDVSQGLTYVWRNPTLRGLGFSVSVTNLAWGLSLILVPVLVVEHAAAPPVWAGVAFAVSGVVGMTSAFVAGRVDTNHREWGLIVLAKVGIAVSSGFLVVAALAQEAAAVAWVLVAMAVLGVASGIWDIGIFTVRQRRTDPVVMGRAFAISMAFNQLGVPIGSALGGWLATDHLVVAAAAGAGAALVGSLLAAVLVPRDEPSTAEHGVP